MTPEEFIAAAREFMDAAVHPTLGRPTRSVTYQPMLELLAELRRRDFTVGIVTGGGTEFVRAISDDLYGVPAELVVGTLIGYDVGRDGQGRPVIRRTSRLLGVANEGSAKVANIQTQLGRRRILASGNSGGDREMLEWAQATGAPTLALLIDHDDAERESSTRARRRRSPRPSRSPTWVHGWDGPSSAWRATGTSSFRPPHDPILSARPSAAPDWGAVNRETDSGCAITFRANHMLHSQLRRPKYRPGLPTIHVPPFSK
ncbi:MAG: hypothetical protein QOC58_283 [Mycobacterium sp.]|jgi:hypothetical protein|nr:hypothetical protein [Mycobacterium sp.]